MQFINFENIVFTIIIDENGEPWWIAKEVCDYLEIKNMAGAIKAIPEQNKKRITIDAFKTTGKETGRGGDNGSRVIINEPAVYMLIGRSRKPEAVAFQQSLYHEVLPSIRKKGSYSIQPGSKRQKHRPSRSPGRPKHTKSEKLITINTNW